MTRVNCGIEVETLTDKHLIAEHREIVRIPNCVSKGRFNLKGQPAQFKLGEGHVKFFYTRLLYLKKRYEEIYSECLKRGFKVTYFGSAWDNVPKQFMNDYTPTKMDIKIVKERIKERLSSKLLIVFFVLFFCSCKTYERSKVVSTWIDPWNVKYTVWRVEKYNRKTDTLISVRCDTTKYDLNGKNIAQEVGDLMR